jgi:5-methylcytosine-specific restriction protein A
MENRPNSSARGYDRKWARTRGRYLQHHKVCEQPGCDAPATDVHHLDGRGPLSPLGHKWINLQALCHPHHSRVTAREQPGGWAAAPPRLRKSASHPGLIDQPSAAS